MVPAGADLLPVPVPLRSWGFSSSCPPPHIYTLPLVLLPPWVQRPSALHLHLEAFQSVCPSIHGLAVILEGGGQIGGIEQWTFRGDNLKGKLGLLGPSEAALLVVLDLPPPV